MMTMEEKLANIETNRNRLADMLAGTTYDLIHYSLGTSILTTSPNPHAYVYKGKTHVASLSQYDKELSVIAKVSKAYGGQDIFEVIPFRKVTEDYLKNLRQHTEEEFNERKQWTERYWLRNDIKKALEAVDKCFSENTELKKKLKEAFALVKDIKEPPSMY